MNNTADRFKVWLFPATMSILAAIIWNDVKEIKSDVKALIAQSNQDKIRIDNLEREIYGNDKNTAEKVPSKNNNIPVSIFFNELVAVKPEENRFVTHPGAPENTSI